MQSDYTQLVICRVALLRCWLAGGLMAGLLHAQGTTPKAKPADYPVHAQLAGYSIAAEYLAHSVPVNGGALDAKDYLVFEIAIYPEGRETPLVSSGDFTLRINNRKAVLFAQTPGMVAASIKYPDWEVRPSLEATAGVGGVDVILGRPPVTSRFPGDPRPDQARLPRQPRVPDQTRPEGAEQAAREPVDVSIARLAFPEGAARAPVSGYLFFAFQAKTKSIRSLELLYSSTQPNSGNRVASMRIF